MCNAHTGTNYLVLLFINILTNLLKDRFLVAEKQYLYMLLRKIEK